MTHGRSPLTKLKARKTKNLSRKNPIKYKAMTLDRKKNSKKRAKK